VHHGGRTVRIRDHAISVDPAEFDRLSEDEAVLAEREALQAWRPERIVLRVDRTDPSKNIVRGIQAFELFLADPARGPAELAEDAAVTRERRRRFAQLKQDERRALLLFALGYSYGEIAERCGWTYTKVNRCVNEGRAALRATAKGES
jgi:trehalose 6-phosphate synthase